ncbi:unnamed protein product [Taenia asiatica]|uniref:Protein YIPF n=1 Tax=Taenia asiatica TaxID=60517 RepID=A0A0R3W861_TAEAS|nr:unnamed protein product [Taenia asiatica]
MLEVETEDSDFDKPILEELDIDLRTIGKKMKAVILPCFRSGLDPASIRENPDFWGPLTVVMLFSLVSLFGQLKVVAWILTIWLAGSFIIYFIARSLGGEVAYAQCLGVIGYCLLPLLLMCAVGALCNLGGFRRLRILIALIGTLWSAYSAGKLLSMENLQQRCSLVVYPIGLLYIYFLSLYTGVYTRLRADFISADKHTGMEDKPVKLGTMVELFLTWLLDCKPYVLNICSLNDIACMFCEERGLKLTKALLAQFHVSAFRFLDKVERAKRASRVRALSTAKHEVGQPFDAGIGMTTLIGK